MAVLAIAATANAFRLQLTQGNTTKIIQTATDDSDVFGDGKVSVSFETATKTIFVWLDGATLSNGPQTEGIPPFTFWGDSEYSKIFIIVEGFCDIRDREDTPDAAMFLSGCEANIISVSESDELYIMSDEQEAIYMDNDATLNIGNIKTASFTVRIRSYESSAIIGSTQTSYPQKLNIYAATVKFESHEDKPLTNGLEEINLQYHQPLPFSSYHIRNSSAGVTFVDDQSYPIQEQLTINGPYYIYFGDYAISPDNDDEFYHPSMDPVWEGKIHYNHSTKTLTLSDVNIESDLLVGYDDFTVNIVGDNVFSPAADNPAVMTFKGKNVKFQGSTKSFLTLYCAGRSGIEVAEDLFIDDFGDIQIYNSEFGFYGKKALTINATPILVSYASKSCIGGFESMAIQNPYLQFNKPRIYNTATQQLENTDETAATNMYLKYEDMLKFYDLAMTTRNMSNFQVPGSEGTVSYDKETATLRMVGFKCDATTPDYGIIAYNDLTIRLEGENTIESSQYGIETSHNLTFKGTGSLALTSTNSYGISFPTDGVLTIQGGASLDVQGVAGIKADATLGCTNSGDPMDPISEPEGTAATLIINNASLKAEASVTDDYNGAVCGFKVLNLTDAAITAPAGASHQFICNGMNAYAGIMLNGEYVSSVTITKTGSTAIESIQKSDIRSQKVIRNGMLFIERNGKLYNAQGAEVR